MMAERQKNAELYSAIWKGKVRKVQELLEAGVKGNIIDKNHKDNTPLHDAIEYGKKDIAEFLLQQQEVGINAVNSKGDTPLNIATFKGNKELVQLLLSKKAKTDIKNNNGRTPLDTAKHLKKQDIIEIFERYFQQDPQASDQRPSTSHNRTRADSEDDESEDGHPKKQKTSTTDGQPIDVDQDPSSSEKTHEDNSNQSKRKKIFILDRENEQYEASGLKRTLHGNVYQLKLLMLFLKRGLKNGYFFLLATEMDEAEKFDDAVFQYENVIKCVIVYRYFQAKHKQDESKRISENDLLTPKDEDFSLQKYFLSYRKIKQNPEFNDQTKELKDFVICTNIDLDDDLQKSFERVEGKDDILDAEVQNTSKEPKRLKYRKGDPFTKKLAPIFREVSDLKRLAKKLAEHVFGRENNKTVGLVNDLFKKYHGALARTVIDIETKKFKEDFVNESPNLPEEVQKFRKFLLEKSELSETNFKEKLETENLNLSKNFGKEFKLDTDPQLTEIDDFVKFIEVAIKNSTQFLVNISRKKGITKKNIDKLAGHVFVETEDGKNKFIREGFLNGDNLPGNLNDFREELKRKGILSQLGKYNFEINVHTCTEKDYEECQKHANYFELPLPNDEVGDEEINDFLDKLVFAVNQPNEVELDDIIEAEMGDDKDINLIDCDLIASKFQKYMLDWMKEKGGRFLSHKDGEEFFKESKQKISKLGLIGPTLAYHAKIENFGIAFSEVPLELKDFLDSPEEQIFNLVSLHKTVLSSVKVYQTLKNDVRYKKDDSHIFVSSSAFLRIKDLVLQAFKSETSNNLLVIECKATNENLGVLYSQLFSIMKSNSNKKVILISQEQDPLASEFRNSSIQYTEKRDEKNSFIDLSVDSQKKLLEEGKVVFQGKEVSLGTLVDYKSKDLVDGDELCKLINNERVEIGKSITDLGETKYYYIDRTFNYQVRIIQKVKEAKTKFFFIHNNQFNAEELKQDQDIVLISNTDNHFSKICKKIEKHNIHWLKQEGSGLLWQRSRGNLSNLREFVDTSTNSITEYQPTEISSIVNETVIISAEPGMGKSTVLTKLAQETKKSDPSVWIVRINLNDYTRQLATVNLDTDSKNKAIKFLSDALILETPLEKNLFKYRINSQGRLFLLCDGFDEISPMFKEKVIQLLKVLKDTNVKTLWVTTRPHIRNTLEDELSAFSCTLQPFIPKDQEIYLAKFWSKRLDLKVISDKDDHRFSVYTQELLNLLKASIADKEVEFTGIPLQTRMLAEAFQDKFKEFYESDQMKLNLPKKLDLVDLYQMFIDKKYNIFSKEKKKQTLTNLPTAIDNVELRRIFTKDHQKAALCMLFEGELDDLLSASERDDMCNFITKVKDGKEMTGLIYEVIGDKPSFIHRTFAEFFAADWFADQIDNQRDFIRKKIFEAENEVLRNFFDRILAKDKEGGNKYEIHNAVLNDDKDKVSELLSESLKAEKIKNSPDRGERTALHLAAAYGHLDVFKVLLGKRADVSAKDKIFGWRPLSYADRKGYWNVAESLLQHKANGDDMYEAIKCINDYKKNCRKNTLIHLAAKEGFIEFVKFIVQKNADIVNAENENGDTPLHMAAFVGKTEVSKVREEEKEFNLNSEDEERNTSLNNAVGIEKSEVVEFLIEGRAFEWGNFDWVLKVCVPLHKATPGGNLDLLEFLVRNGANVNAESINLNTPLHRAVFSGNLEVVKFLLKEDANIDACDSKGRTPLHDAAYLKYLDIVKLLVRNGADVNLKTACSTNLLHNTVSGYLEVRELLSLKGYYFDVISVDDQGRGAPVRRVPESGNLELVKYLVDDKRVYLNVLDKDGKTPLHVAAENGDLDIVKYFLREKGAGVDWRNESELLHCAVKSGNLGTVKCLIEEIAANVEAPDTAKRTPLHWAAEKGVLDIVNYLIKEKGVDVNAREIFKRTPLHLAVRYADLDTVKCLIDGKEADVNALDIYERTPLHGAVEAENLDVIKYLIKETEVGVNAEDCNGRTPLHLAVVTENLQVLKYLFSEGKRVDANAADEHERTPLHMAAECGALDIVKYLIEEKGANMNARDEDGRIPLHLAVDALNMDIAKYLMNKMKAGVNAVDKVRRTPPHMVIKNKNLDIAKYLINRMKAGVNVVDEDRRTLLHMAARNGHLAMVKYLIETIKADVTAQDENGRTPLHMAIENENLDIVKYLVGERRACMNMVNPRILLIMAVTHADLDFVKSLIEVEYADVNAQDKYGSTPLHWAVGIENLVIVKYLIEEKGAAFNTPDKQAITPLHVAAAAGNLDIVKYLIEEKGVNVNTPDEQAITPLHMTAAAGNMDIVKYLIREKEANFYAPDKQAITPLHMAASAGNLGIVKYLVEKNGANFYAPDKQAITPLHMAASAGNLGIVKYLVEEKGANFYAPDKQAITTLHMAAAARNIDTIKYLMEEKGADLHALDKQAIPPLHMAAAAGNLDTVKYLIEEKGVNVNTPDEQAITPLHMAAAAGNMDIVKYLIEEKEADFNAPDYEGKTLLHKAAARFERKYPYKVKYLKTATPLWDRASDCGKLDVVRYLLEEKGANINAQDNDGRTALHLASWACKWDTVEYLIKERGANIHVRDKDGEECCCLDFSFEYMKKKRKKEQSTK